MRRALLLATLAGFACDLSTEQPKSDAVIKFKSIEDSIPVSDTGVKYVIRLEGTPGPVIKASTSTLTLVYKDGGSEKREKIASETDDGTGWSPEDNPFPGSVGGDWELGGMVYMEDAENAKMRKLYDDREANGLKLMLGVELKTEGGAITPAEEEITLLPPNN